MKSRLENEISTIETNPMVKPNFFLLGAGRCGTTTLYNVLRQHPEIFMPEVKEPSFFCSYFRVIRDPISYFRLFSPKGGERAIGEASHVYFSNPETPPVLHLLFPEAKFILILRNPTNRAYSLYQWARKEGYETLSTFEEAIMAEPKRYRDLTFFRKCPQYFWNFMYIRSSYYHVQLKRYLRFYDLNRFFILSLFELSEDPFEWAKSIYEFLGVSTDFRPNFEHLHASEYKEMRTETRIKLDRHFRVVVDTMEKFVGRDMKLARI